MRTIIINTLGGEMPLHELLFLPFGEDRFVCINTNMGEIGACAQKVEAYCNAQDRRGDYRLMVLADLGGYADVDRDEVRGCFRGVLTAYMNRMLFLPLARDLNLPPSHITLVFTVSRSVTGGGRIEGGRYYDYVLGFPEDRPFHRLELTRLLEDGRRELLDVTEVFSDLIEATGVREAQGNAEKHRSDINYFRRQLPETLRLQQKCGYTPAGSMQSVEIPVETHDFFPACMAKELIWVELQLNISRMLARQYRMRRGGIAELKLKSYEEDELALRFRKAQLRLSKLMKEAPDQKYFPLEAREGPDPVSLYNRIWNALLEKKELLPGVQEADDHRRGKDTVPKAGTGFGLRRAWIRMDREKKQFDALCEALNREHDPQIVRRQQQEILEICAGEFRDWRSSVLSGKPVEPEPERAVPCSIPELNTARMESRLRQAQVRCGAMAADKLEDYQDLRQEAEQIKADFRKTAKFWMPDCKNANTRYFLTYSGILALLFLIQMLVPYAGITLGQADASFGNYLHFFASAGIFAGAYLIGLLIWLRQMCRELGHHSRRMADLILRSGLRRRDSIEAIVKSYGEDLPRCAIGYRQLRELRMLNDLNRERYERYRAHMDLLNRAEELLLELRTQLQLSIPATDRLCAPEQVIRGIDYQQSPADPVNIPYYILLSDDWGDGAC